MATYNKFNQFVEDLHHKVHDLDNDALTVALCAAANAPVATDEVLADLTPIDYTNLSSRVLVKASSGQTSGTYKWIPNDLTLSASGGAVAAFRYVVVYNDTPTSPADPLICWYDYATDLTLSDGESLLLDFGANGLFSDT